MAYFWVKSIFGIVFLITGSARIRKVDADKAL